MPLSNYIIWSANPVLLQLGPVAIRWYGLMIVLSFWGGRQVIRYVFRKTGRPAEDVDKLSGTLLLGMLVSARLGHVLLHEFTYYYKHPLEAILPVRLSPHLHFTGYQGFSMHGAILGGMVVVYLYSSRRITFSLVPLRFSATKQRRKGQSSLWLSTPLTLSLLMVFLIRIGNFFNSETIGKPTHSQYGVLFVRHVLDQLKQDVHAIESVKVSKNTLFQEALDQYQPIILELTFRENHAEAETVKLLVERVQHHLATDPYIREHVYQPPKQALDYTLTKNRKQAYVAQIKTWGIPRHPVQLYEGFSYLLILLALLYWWHRDYKTLKDGVIAGTAAVVSASLRTVYEFLKESSRILIQGSYPITQGHLLSLLTVLGGVALLCYLHTSPQHDKGRS